LRLSLALALSLYLHAFLISLELGDPGFGWPGFAKPQAERRVQAPDLTVRLEEAPRLQMPVPSAAVTATIPKPAAPPRAGKTFEAVPPVVARAAPPTKPLSRPRRKSAAPAPAAKVRARKPEIRAEPQPEILAQSDPQEETFSVPPPAPPEPQPPRAPEIEASRKTEVESRKEEEEARRKEEGERRKEEQQQLALQKEQEAQRIEETLKQEEAEAGLKAEGERREKEEQQLALELEAKKQEEAQARRKEEEEASRKAEGERRKEEEAQRLALEEARRKEEEQRLALQKEQEARHLALEAEALRRAEETEARRKAEVERRKEEERQQAEEAAARARAQESADRQRAGTQAAPGALSGKELAAKVLGQLRTPGGVPLAPPRPPSDPSRRRSISSPERDVVLRMYVEGWRSKIERNGPLNYRPLASRQARDYPVVTVSIRSDGSLEDVLIHRSSGLRELDEAVRRIARLYAPYSAFPPEVARQYDVIEIRRVWQFGDTLSIVEETR
jgi:TolA protein